MPNVIKSGNSNELEGVTNNHLAGKTNSDVHGLYLRNQSIETVPKFIEKFFPNLICISIHRSNLKRISSDDLKVFPGLILLHVDHNYVESLDGNLFQYNPRLKVFFVINNQLRHVGFNLLSNLNLLSIAMFTNNPCINVGVSNNAGLMRDLQYKIAVYCPPTFEMFEKTLLSSSSSN
jgi:Leucine-rich repeat (LRR) protein